ncbi:caspase family protein [Mesorhizobium sp. WSM4313]|uniref:caspase family protein n=1 Tax=Mesorhizobium sp. WSM4313 TaxID=2029412 RepID=UPI000BAFEFD7|nr:caspase family protein [Mesorhizobium sp. WSM4313]PBB20399.1 hypothetical protein CK219_10535 [Mesorhizobium sp. WSM4313]
MKRRQFISMSAVLSATLLTRAKIARSQPLTRGAVVIGVDSISGLQKLSATDGAKSIADWLTSEAFEVKLLVDTNNGKVSLNSVFNAVAEFVNRGTMEMLVVYFAGHGYMSGCTEWWMLSDAPANPNEAISLLESSVLAKECGIPNVVFISDACRSTPDSLNASFVKGGYIFPNNTGSANVADVDKFMATRAGSAALELPVSTSIAQGYQGIFTACFLDAFQKSSSDMVLTLRNGVAVVPNRLLKNYLKKEVLRRAQLKSITLRQQPDVEVTSNDDVYMGKAHVAAQPPVSNIKIVPWNSIVDLALKEVGASFSNDALATNNVSFNVTNTDVAIYSRATGFDATKEQILAAPTPLSFETQTGFSVTGMRVIQATASSGQATVTDDGSSGRFALVKIELPPQSPGASVAIRFGDGSGTVVAAIGGFIGNIVASGDGVTSVTYVPSTNSVKWSEYASESARLKRLHAVVAAATSLGAFRIEGNRPTRERKGQEIGDDIRILKSLDPTLGVYAAYAYWDADLRDSVRSVSGLMSNDLGMGLFDVEMLARKKPSSSLAVVPFCPMLTQGWEFLRVLGSETDQLNRLKPFLKDSLWTTFDAVGMDKIL